MERLAFSFVLVIHGLLHLMGFAKAFGYGNLQQISSTISKSIGLIWLLTALAFIIAATFFLLVKHWWIISAILAVILSQMLLASAWKDAKYGTFANAFILLVILVSLADGRWNQETSNHAKKMLSSTPTAGPRIISSDMFKDLPPIVRTWLIRSGIIGLPEVYNSRIKQSGQLRTSPKGKWKSFKAEEYFNIPNQSFLWDTRVNILPVLWLRGRDKFEEGKGALDMMALSIIPIAGQTNQDQVNKGSAVRFLGEICWFPSAAISGFLEWKQVDELTAEATMTYPGGIVNGMFHFTTEGDLATFTASRYYIKGTQSSLEKWEVRLLAYEDWENRRIPVKCEVTWKLKDGDFTWLRMELAKVEYNVSSR